MPLPTILVVPAASALPLFYDKIIDKVTSAGHTIEVLRLPSIATDNNGGGSGVLPSPPPTMYDDVACITARVEELADGNDEAEGGQEVVLMAHSYGGTPATESIRLLSRASRRERGLRGGIVALAYMTALVPEVGNPAAKTPVSNLPPPSRAPLMAVGEDGWFYYPDLELAATRVFSNLTLDEGMYWASKLAKHSAASFAGPLTYGGYNEVPVSYLVCEDDQSIFEGTQRAEIAMIERESGSKVDVTSIQADHVPVISAPDLVVDWIISVAEKYA